MPNITINLARVNTNWVFQATPIEAFINALNEFVDIAPFSTTIPSGKTATLDIPASNNANVSYLYEAYQSNTVEDFYTQDGALYASSDTLLNRDLPRWQWTTGAGFNSQWYTGQQLGTNPPATENKLLTRKTRTVKRNLIDPVTAIMPNAVTDLRTLANASVSSGNLDAGARRIAELMLSDPSLKVQLPKGLNPRGQYAPATTYNQNDAVSYNGELWVMFNASPQLGITPGTNVLVWEKYVSKGSPGGTGAIQVGYNNATWTAQPATFLDEATARGDLLAAMNSVATPNLTGYATETYVGNQLTANNSTQRTSNDGRYGQLAAANTWSQVNTVSGASSGLIVPDRTAGDNTQNAANTKFVTGAIALLPVGGGRAGLALSRVRRDTSNIPFTGKTVIVWNNRLIIGIVDGGGGITPAVSGEYRIDLLLALALTGTFSAAGGTMTARCHLHQGITEIAEMIRVDTNEVNGTRNFLLAGWYEGALNAGVTYDIRLQASGSNLSGTGVSGNLLFPSHMVIRQLV